MAFQDWQPREHLAAFAMVGILAGDHDNKYDAETIASWAYGVADAMIDFRRQETDKAERTEEP